MHSEVKEKNEKHKGRTNSSMAVSSKEVMVKCIKVSKVGSVCVMGVIIKKEQI